MLFSVLVCLTCVTLCHSHLEFLFDFHTLLRNSLFCTFILYQTTSLYYTLCIVCKVNLCAFLTAWIIHNQSLLLYTWQTPHYLGSCSTVTLLQHMRRCCVCTIQPVAAILASETHFMGRLIQWQLALAPVLVLSTLCVVLNMLPLTCLNRGQRTRE